MYLKFSNGSSFMFKDMRHVPQLTKSLISIEKHDNGGNHVTFGDCSWKIAEGSLVVARGSNSKTLYMLHVSSVKNHVIVVTE